MSDQHEFQGLNFKNYLSNLGSCWDGFTTLDLIKEFIDNSLDSKSTYIKLNAKNRYIHYIDNGNGMNKKNLFRLAEFYSTNNEALGNGKFGIGGNKAQVALSDLHDTWYNKQIKIITKTSNGDVHSITINWDKCNTLENYIEQIKTSYKFKDVEDNKVFDKQISSISGTYIKIHTSDQRVQELSKWSTNLSILINLSITYEEYINRGLDIIIGNKKLIVLTKS